MTLQKTVRADLTDVFLLTVARLFLIPVATLFFTGCAQRTQDTAFLARVDQQVTA